MEDGNPDFVRDTLINFEKRNLIYSVIAEVARHQTTPYNFPVLEPIFTFLKELPTFSERESYNLSMAYEPRSGGSAAPAEKVSFKSRFSTVRKASGSVKNLKSLIKG
jgi:hypothetical protein